MNPLTRTEYQKMRLLQIIVHSTYGVKGDVKPSAISKVSQEYFQLRSRFNKYGTESVI